MAAAVRAVDIIKRIRTKAVFLAKEVEMVVATAGTIGRDRSPEVHAAPWSVAPAE